MYIKEYIDIHTYIHTYIPTFWAEEECALGPVSFEAVAGNAGEGFAFGV